MISNNNGSRRAILSRNTPMQTSSNTNANASGQSQSQSQNLHRHHPNIREIHKNAWLKRIVAIDGKKGASSFIATNKKSEKLWVVFCVHDDLEAFLEFYPDPKIGATHKPTSAISLNSCLHVSSTIIGEDNEFQFAITLPTQVIRLFAATWDQMIEWVESLQGKLREMNILSPKDNVYSRLPETRNTQIIINNNYGVSTRDPNSPLPPTPSNILLNQQNLLLEDSFGENLQASNSNTINSNPIIGLENSTTTINLNVTELSYQLPSDYISTVNENQSNTPTAAITISEQNGGSSEVSTSHLNTENLISLSRHDPSSTLVYVQPTIHLTSSIDVTREGQLRVEELETSHNIINSSLVVTRNNLNTTVVQVNSSDLSNISSTNSNFDGHSSIVAIPSQSTSGLSSSHNQSNSKTSFPINRCNIKKSNDSMSSRLNTEFIRKETPKACSSGATYIRQFSAPSEVSMNSSENVYEHIFLSNSTSTTTEPSTSKRIQINRSHSNASKTNISHDLSRINDIPPAIPRKNFQDKKIQKKETSSQTRSSSLGRLNEPESSSSQLQGNSNATINNNNRIEINQRIGTRENNLAPQHSRDERNNNVPLEAIIGLRDGEYRIRHQDVHVHGESLQVSQNVMNQIPLKEQQVLRLKAEIEHPVGVRVVLRKKDCVNSIAFIDYLGAVWIAGWKQHQNPVLYYAFHIGDQILKVAGVNIHTSEEAYRAIKMVSTLQIEFIYRRLPFGKVFVLKRKSEGEPLGLITSENNCGEIIEVVPGGLSSSQGLPPKSNGTDGTSICNWYLTEINNRPVSLTARESEIKDRLKAVGKEISILVQPSDLVKHLKKCLKSMKGFKDYLVV